MGKCHIFISVHAQKTEIMGFCSPWRRCWFMCQWHKRNCLHHYNGTCVPPREQMYLLSVFLHVVERRTIPLWPNKYRQTEFVSNELSYVDSKECIERELIALLQDAMYFAYNKDNTDLSSTHIKGHCIPHSSQTCSVPPGEQMYLSVFFTWSETEKPSRYDTTKTGRLNWFLPKYQMQTQQTLARAFPDLVQGFT